MRITAINCQKPQLANSQSQNTRKQPSFEKLFIAENVIAKYAKQFDENPTATLSKFQDLKKMAEKINLGFFLDENGKLYSKAVPKNTKGIFKDVYGESTTESASKNIHTEFIDKGMEAIRLLRSKLNDLVMTPTAKPEEKWDSLIKGYDI